MPKFSETIKLRVATTKTWRDQLVEDQEKMINETKRDQMQGYIDILNFWIELGEHLQTFLP